MDTPNCCGSDIICLPDSFTEEEATNHCRRFQTSGMMTVVFAKKLPSIVKKITDGVGVLIYKSCRIPDSFGLMGFTRVYPSNVCFHVNADVRCMRMRDDIYFLYDLDGITAKMLDLKKWFKKGDTLLAISGGYQSKERNVLKRMGWKIAYHRLNPKSGCRIKLHLLTFP